jgi:hypothetical protein
MPPPRTPIDSIGGAERSAAEERDGARLGVVVDA